MKKIFYSTLLAGCALLCSCENDFDAKIYGVLSTTNFPASQSDYEAYLMDCYVPFTINWGYSFGSAWQHNWYVPEGGFYRMFDVTSDEMDPWVIGSWGGEWTTLCAKNFEACVNDGRATNSPGINHFEKIRDITRFTKIIGDLQSADASIFDAGVQDQYIAEARFLRGLMMYYLGQVYGPVPVIVDPELATDEEATAHLERPSVDDYARYITEDFEYAIAHLPEKAAVGRYNADYARVVLMRHYLNEGYHMDGYYGKAAALKGQLTGSYSLFPTYKEQFYSANDGNCESIMAVPCTSSATGSGTQGNMNCFCFYAFPWDFAHYDDQGNATPAQYISGWGECFNISKNFYDTFEKGDTRLECILTSYYSSAYGWVTEATLGSQWDGFIINKYPCDVDGGGYQSNDVPLARWADVLLLHAEALTRSTNSVQAEAVNEINQIRHRAGLADLTADKTASVDAFLNAILDESGHETFYEGHRKTDLIRFGQYYKRCSAFGYAPTHEYFPLPNYAIDQAQESGYTLQQTFTTSNYDGPKN